MAHPILVVLIISPAILSTAGLAAGLVAGFAAGLAAGLAAGAVVGGAVDITVCSPYKKLKY
jgi:hypothetical protein